MIAGDAPPKGHTGQEESRVDEAHASMQSCLLQEMRSELRQISVGHQEMRGEIGEMRTEIRQIMAKGAESEAQTRLMVQGLNDTMSLIKETQEAYGKLTQRLDLQKTLPRQTDTSPHLMTMSRQSTVQDAVEIVSGEETREGWAVSQAMLWTEAAAAGGVLPGASGATRQDMTAAEAQHGHNAGVQHVKRVQPQFLDSPLRSDPLSTVSSLFPAHAESPSTLLAVASPLKRVSSKAGDTAAESISPGTPACSPPPPSYQISSPNRSHLHSPSQLLRVEGAEKPPIDAHSNGSLLSLILQLENLD